MPCRPAAAALILALLLAGCSGMKADADKPAAAPVAAAAPVDLPPPPVMEVQTEPMPAPPVPAPAPPPVMRFAGHVASFKNQAEAERGWVALSKRYSILQGLTPRYIEVDLGGSRGKTVRVLLGGFVDRDGARSYCYDMRREGLFCAPHSLPNSGPLPNAG